MENLIPIFPLNLVLFPEERINLHVFEPRYIELINQVDASVTSFGIPPYLDGLLSDIGTEVILESIEKRYDNGRMDVRAIGIGIFKIHQVYDRFPHKLFSGASVEMLDIDLEPDPIKNLQIIELVEQLFKALQFEKQIDMKSRESLSYSVGHFIGLEKRQELQLLSFTKETERQDFILAHLSSFVPKAMQIEEMRRKVMMNGHFRHFDPLDFNLG
jgi:Lon protease-like protein